MAAEGRVGRMRLVGSSVGARDHRKNWRQGRTSDRLIESAKNCDAIDGAAMGRWWVAWGRSYGESRQEAAKSPRSAGRDVMHHRLLAGGQEKFDAVSRDVFARNMDANE